MWEPLFKILFQCIIECNLNIHFYSTQEGFMNSVSEQRLFCYLYFCHIFNSTNCPGRMPARSSLMFSFRNVNSAGIHERPQGRQSFIEAVRFSLCSALVILKRETETLNTGSVLSSRKEGLSKSAWCSTAEEWIQARDCQGLCQSRNDCR